MLIVALICGILVFVLMLLTIEYFTRDKNAIARKVQHYAAGDAGTSSTASEQESGMDANFMNLVRYLGSKLRNVPTTKNLEIKMQQAGLPLLGSEFLALLGVLALVFGLFSLMLTLKISYAILGGIAGVLAGWLYLSFRISRRWSEFSNQLGDALAMMANAMRSGFSFTQAMDLIGKEMRAPISFEFFKTLAEMRLGADVETALLNMGRRVQSSDLDLVITAVLIQRQVGGNLAQILDMIAQTINERIKMKREIKTLTAQGRLSGWILAALPFAVAGMMAMVNPRYIEPLFTQKIGQIFVGGALVLELIGFIIIQKIASLDV